MPRNLIETTAATFADVKIFHAAALGQVQRTSFTWTDLPGAMCLAVNKSYYAEAIANPNIVAIVAPARIAVDRPASKALLLTDRCAELFYRLHNLGIHTHARTASRQARAGVGAGARIAPTAVISAEASIGPGVVVSDYCVVQGPVEIGPDCVLHPFVTVGTEGFFSKVIDGRKSHIHHFGGVRIGSNCILHTGTNVSRSVNFNEVTELKSDVHVGIHCNIGHDCQVGENCDLAAWVLLLGRVRIGSGTWIGANAAVANAVKVGSNSTIRLGSVVIEDLPAGSDVSGNFAVPHARSLRSYLGHGQS